jgi:NADP-reducing hydrogenase subunit HndC
LGKPTNVNNVETFANIPVIYLKGAEWFSSIGTEKSKGTKVFALAGKINNVGLLKCLWELPLGKLFSKLVVVLKEERNSRLCKPAVRRVVALTEKHLDTPIDYDNLIASGSMMGSGGMIVMDEDDCMVSMAKFFLEFTVEESCGNVLPCRIGNKRLYEILDKITKGKVQ